MNEIKQVYLLGLIVGFIILILGIASFVNYLTNGFIVSNSRSTFGYLFAGIGFVIVGLMFLGEVF